jgi:hypothetical protein
MRSSMRHALDVTMASGGGIGAFPGNVGDRRVGYFSGLPRETEARERILKMWLAPAIVMAFLRPIISAFGHDVETRASSS